MTMDPLTQKLIGSGSPFELVTVTSWRRELKIYRHAPGTLPQLYRRALKRGERELMVFDNTRATLQQSFGLAERMAALLQQKYAIRAGSRVGLDAAGPPTWLIAFLAITSIGAVPVLIGNGDGKHVRGCIAETRCALVITDQNVFSASVDGQQHCVAAAELLAMARQSTLQLSTPAVPQAGDEAVVLFTSGSTGTPKAVSLSHRNVISGLMNMMLGSAIAAGEGRDRPTMRSTSPPCALVHTPLYYIGGLSAVLMAIMNGTRIVVTSGWNIDAICALVLAEKVTALPNIGRTQLEELIARDRVSGLTSIGLHGAGVPERLIEHVAATQPALKVVSGYGLTETVGSIAVITGSTLRSRPGSSGRIVPTVDVCLGGPQRFPEKNNEAGELFLAGACVMNGYLRDGKVSYVDWFNTSDIAHITEDGHIYVDHRSCEASVINGTYVNAAAVERQLEDLDGVAEASVLTDQQQQRIDVIVAMKPGRKMERSVIADALAASVGTNAEVRIHCGESLPRTPSGKINRVALRLSVAGMPCQ